MEIKTKHINSFIWSEKIAHVLVMFICLCFLPFLWKNKLCFSVDKRRNGE